MRRRDRKSGADRYDDALGEDRPLSQYEVDNPLGIDYDRWAAAFTKVKPALCNEGKGCRRCRARLAEWERER